MAEEKKRKERRDVGELEQRQKGRETDSDKWRKLPKLERQRILSAETRWPLPIRAHFHLTLSPSTVPLRSGWWSGPHITGPGSVETPGPLYAPAWLCQSVLAGAWFQPRGEGRGPVAEERLRLDRGRSSWLCACRSPPPKAGPENSQLERVEPGQRSWKGAGPDTRGSPRRAGGALGCHKVNGRRRGVAVHGEAHSLPASPGAPERSGGLGAGGRPPPRPGARPLAPACPPDCGRRRRCRESACCGTHCECLTMRETGTHGAEGPWLDFGIPKTGPREAELEHGAWGTGRDWEGGVQTRGQDLEKGKLSVRTRRTDKRKTQGIEEKSET